MSFGGSVRSVITSAFGGPSRTLSCGGAQPWLNVHPSIRVAACCCGLVSQHQPVTYPGMCRHYTFYVWKDILNATPLAR